MFEYFVKKLSKDNRGFTLIELVVVIAILGILSAIAVPKMSGFQDTAKAQANKQTAAQIKSAIAMALASGEIEVKEGENGKKASFTIKGEDNKVYDCKGFTTPGSEGDMSEEDMESLLADYMSKIELQPMKKHYQDIKVTIDDTEVKAEVVTGAAKK